MVNKRIYIIIVIILYCYITLICGIIHTKNILRNDVITQRWEWGRNTLICSYWYELYNTSKTIEWYKKNINKPIVYISGDKAATPNYLMHYKMPVWKETPTDSFFVWCIYPNTIASKDYNIVRVNPVLSWQNIFFVTRKNE